MKRPKWIRATLVDSGNMIAGDIWPWMPPGSVSAKALDDAGYRPGDKVVVMSEAEARWLRHALKSLRELHAEELDRYSCPGPCDCGCGAKGAR